MAKKYVAANDHKGIAPMHDHVLVYRKSESFVRNLLERAESKDDQYRYENKAGVFRVSDYTCNKTADERPNLYYAIKNPNTGEEVWPKKTRVWAYSKEEHEKNTEANLVWWGKDGKSNTPSFKRYRHLLKGGGGTVPRTWLTWDFAGHTDEAKKELQEINDWKVETQTITPKPVRLIQRILEIATDKNSLILDSFAGSGTTAHAVLALNKKDGGHRKFILVETEDYADKLTAERVRRVIAGYQFEGTQREELLREEMDLGRLLTGDKLPSFDALAKYVFYTATGRTLEEVPRGSGRESAQTSTPKEARKKKSELTDHDKTGFIGETELYRVHLLYRPEKKWLASNDAALTEQLVAKLQAGNREKKRLLVFAAAKFMSQKELTRLGVEFCQLPYAIHRILGD